MGASARTTDQRPCHRDILLLAAGQLGRLVFKPFAKSNEVQNTRGLVVSILRRHTGKNHPQHDIFETGHDRDKIESLENVSDLSAPQARQFERVELCDIDFIDEHFALKPSSMSSRHCSPPPALHPRHCN